MAYIDLDNFKTVNDRLGHTGGDQVLRAVVSHINMHLRKTDVVARLGGDEFALLFPETNQEAAQAVVIKIQSGLLEEMQQMNWPVTFSNGVVTCAVSPRSTDDLVRMADKVMYSVKREGKNAITYRTYSE
jgi:diguanylate cyclase (GGDEF)-like protein